MKSSCQASHLHLTLWRSRVEILNRPREPKVSNFALNVVRRGAHWLYKEQIKRLEVSVQYLRLLYVQEVHAFSNVKCHLEPLFHRELHLLLLVEQREYCSTKAELCENEDLTPLVV